MFAVGPISSSKLSIKIDIPTNINLSIIEATKVLVPTNINLIEQDNVPVPIVIPTNINLVENETA